MLDTLLHHILWADRRTAESLDTLDPPPADVVRIWAHLLGAEATWLARLAGRIADVAVWPELDVAECRALMTRNHEELSRITDGSAAEMTRAITYRNSHGEQFTNTVAGILHHVALHGMYHRGQVALEVRRRGGVPLSTDLIVYLRVGDG